MAIKSLPQTLKDLATGIKNTITGVTGSNATLTITKGNGTTSTVTVNNVANATNAIKAMQDSAGQQINTTYIKGLSVSGKIVTYTKGNGTTGTITTQDTAYTHPNSGVSAGTYTSVTVNAQGHVTAGSNLANNNTLVESKYNADGSWYRKWSDGWLEQGGYSFPATSTVSFLKPFSDNNYNLLTQPCDKEATTGGASYMATFKHTVTGFSALASSSIAGYEWQACGY